VSRQSGQDPLAECLGLVHDVASAHAGPGHPLSLLLALGVAGLMEAEESRGSITELSFEAHAAGRILRRMLATNGAEPRDAPRLDAVLACLPDRERHVLRLLLVEGMTLRQAAAVLRTSSERVRQLRSKAMRRLRTGRFLTGAISNPDTGAL